MAETMLLVGDSETNANLYYATHFLAGDPFLFVRQGERSLLVVSAMELGRAQKQSSAGEVRSFDDFGYREMLKDTNDRDQTFGGVVLRVLQELGADQARV